MESNELIDQINSINSEAPGRPVKKVAKQRRAVPSRASQQQTYSRRRTVRRNPRHTTVRRRRPLIDLSGVNPILLIGILAAAVLLIGGGIAFIIWYNSFTRINLSDYVSLKLSGYNEYGSAEIELSQDPEYSEFFGTVDASLNLTENLSNGDELVITYDYDKDLAKENKLRVDSSDSHVTVSGLADAQVITHDELFENVTVDFTGTAPCVKPEIENTATEEPFSEITYSVEGEKQYFDLGDEVVIRAQIPGELLADHAYSFNLSDDDYCSTYTVPDGDRYFTDASQVTDEILSELEQVGFDLISQSDAKEYGLRIFQGEAKIQPVFVGNSTTFEWANPYVISAYFHAVTEEGKSNLECHANDVQVVYGVTITQADGKSVLAEMVIQFVDLLTHEDGTVDNAAESGRIVSVSYKDANIKELVNDEADGSYITTKLTE